MAFAISNEITKRENLIVNIKFELIENYLVITGIPNITHKHAESICDMFERFGQYKMLHFDSKGLSISFEDERDLVDACKEITEKVIADVLYDF